MSWRKIPMKYPGKCIVCNGQIRVNEMGLWAKGLGVKHERCAEAKELKCALCGGPAGCPMCEFQDNCDISNVSELCICKKCSGQKDAFGSYRQSVSKKFQILNS